MANIGVCDCPAGHPYLAKQNCKEAHDPSSDIFTYSLEHRKTCYLQKLHSQSNKDHQRQLIFSAGIGMPLAENFPASSAVQDGLEETAWSARDGPAPIDGGTALPILNPPPLTACLIKAGLPQDVLVSLLQLNTTVGVCFAYLLYHFDAQSFTCMHMLLCHISDIMAVKVTKNRVQPLRRSI